MKICSKTNRCTVGEAVKKKLRTDQRLLLMMMQLRGELGRKRLGMTNASNLRVNKMNNFVTIYSFK